MSPASAPTATALLPKPSKKSGVKVDITRVSSITLPPVSDDPRFPRVSGGFFCRACLREREPKQTSPDPRYCVECYDFLTKEARGSVNSRGQWVPLADAALVTNLYFECRDRIQVYTRQVMDSWYTITALNDGVSVATDHGTFEISEITAHRKEDTNMKPTLTAQENLARVRATLADLQSKKADARVLGLWKSKLAQAERMCQEAPVITNAAITGLAPAVQVESVVAAPSVGGELPQAENARVVSISPAKAGSTPTVKASKSGPCLCGCGQIAPSGRFLQGHDSKFASMIRKLDKGLLQKDALPASVRAMLDANHPEVAKARAHNK